MKRLEGKRLLAKPRSRWDDNIQIDLNEGMTDQAELIWFTVVSSEGGREGAPANTVMSVPVPQKTGNFTSS